MREKKEIVLVTGGSRGIGKATVERFAREGYPVVLHYRTGKAEAEQIAETLRAEGCMLLLQQADIRNSVEVTRMIEEVTMQWGPVNILVNNAGIAQQKLFTDLTDEDWRNMFAVHVDGTFYCTRTVLPAMIHQKKGCIVNISSMWGQVGGSCEVHYSAAKGAIQTMTKALAQEVGLSGIRVNCVAPGVIQTEMNGMLDKETLDALREETPIHRLGTAEDVANVIYFLATEASDFITGQVIGVNGGMVVS